MWRAPDAEGASGRKYTTANAALEAVRRKAAEPPNGIEEDAARPSPRSSLSPLSAAASVDAQPRHPGSTPVAR